MNTYDTWLNDFAESFYIKCVLRTVSATILTKDVSLVQLLGHLLLHRMFLLKVRESEALVSKDHKMKLPKGNMEANERQN